MPQDMPGLTRAGRATRWARLKKMKQFVLPAALVVVLGSDAAILGFQEVKARLRNARDLREHRAPTGNLYYAAQVESEGSYDTIMLREGSQVFLAPFDSRFTLGAPLLLTPGPLRAALDGLATIVVKSPREIMDLNTSAGRAWLAPGTYEVFCLEGCKGMVVHVVNGVAVIRGFASNTEVALHDGDDGVVKRGGGPEKVDKEHSNQLSLAQWWMDR